MFRTLSESSVNTSDDIVEDVSATEAELPGLLLHTGVDSMQTDPSYRSQAVDGNEAPTEHAGAPEDAPIDDKTRNLLLSPTRTAPSTPWYAADFAGPVEQTRHMYLGGRVK